MNDLVFSDTGFWIALFDSRDQYHVDAEATLRIVLTDYRLCISDFVIYETITYLNCSLKNHRLALKFLAKMEDTGIRVLEADPGVRKEAMRLFGLYDDKPLSFTDCTSFVLMTNAAMRYYVGFDDHFSQMGFRSVSVRAV
jgi:predicted nucleic acid-binding protein